MKQLRKNYKTFFLQFLVINVILIFMVLNANPYRINPVEITIPRFNDIKPKIYDHMVYVKLFDITKIKPKTLIMGSSRVLWGIDPKEPLLNKYPPVYNSGVLMRPLVEMKSFFDHALNAQPHLKRVILALDLFAFNPAYDNRDFDPTQLVGKNWFEMMTIRKDFALDFVASFETIYFSLFRKYTKSLREDGRLNMDPLQNPDVFKDFLGPSPGKIQKKTAEKLLLPPSVTIPEDFVQGHHLPFQISRKDLDVIHYIIDTCKQRNIELIIYFTPTSQNDELNLVEGVGMWPEYNKLRREIAKLHPFWDFNDYNELIMEPKNFIYGSHHIFSLGHQMIVSMFGTADDKKELPKNFGTYITADNVDMHLKTIYKDYLTYDYSG